jgi:hypothetical protein
MKKIFLILLLFCTFVFSQTEKTLLSGSLINDTQFAFEAIQSADSSYKLSITHNKKKPFLAGIMSFAVPGAGQIYTEDFLKAGIYAAIEVGAIVLAVSYDNKGDDQTEFYEDYANDNWSASRYANWSYENANKLIELYNQQKNASRELLNLDDYANLFYDAERTQVNWSVLNKLEEDIGWYYSHKLAPFGDQQYYEMIGKYSQFNVGWIEFGDDVTKPYSFGVPVVEQFKWYSKERGKANDYYNIAKWAVIAVVSNHFISAIDAAWSASKFNKRLNFNISLESENIGFYKDYYPQLNLSYSF